MEDFRKNLRLDTESCSDEFSENQASLFRGDNILLNSLHQRPCQPNDSNSVRSRNCGYSAIIQEKRNLPLLGESDHLAIGTERSLIFERSRHHDSYSLYPSINMSTLYLASAGSAFGLSDEFVPDSVRNQNRPVESLEKSEASYLA